MLNALRATSLEKPELELDERGERERAGREEGGVEDHGETPLELLVGYHLSWGSQGTQKMLSLAEEEDANQPTQSGVQN